MLATFENAILVEHCGVLQDEPPKVPIRKGFADVCRTVHCLKQLFHPSTAIDRGFAEALPKLGNEEGGAAFVPPSALH
jgi:hypothetical protein